MTNSLPDFDLYEELQISPSASPEIVTAAYTRLARLYHPDTGERRDETKMVRLNRAYDILSHPERRRVYDLSRTPRRPLTSDRKPFAYGRGSRANPETAARGEPSPPERPPDGAPPVKDRLRSKAYMYRAADEPASAAGGLRPALAREPASSTPASGGVGRGIRACARCGSANVLADARGRGVVVCGDCGAKSEAEVQAPASGIRPLIRRPNLSRPS
jgi:curved DNA-binding protein CbpA